MQAMTHASTMAHRAITHRSPSLLSMNEVDPQDVLRRLMTDAGIETQAELAEVVGVSPNQVNRWLRGRANPPVRQLRRVIEQVGLNPADYGLRPALRRVDAAFSADEPPAWFSSAVAEINEKLDRLIRAEERRR